MSAKVLKPTEKFKLGILSKDSVKRITNKMVNHALICGTCHIDLLII